MKNLIAALGVVALMSTPSAGRAEETVRGKFELRGEASTGYPVSALLCGGSEPMASI
jgi:hypothetical protein